MRGFLWVVQVAPPGFYAQVRWVTSKTMRASYTDLFSEFKQQHYNVSLAIF